MSFEDKLKMCNLRLELKLERCDNLVKKSEEQLEEECNDPIEEVDQPQSTGKKRGRKPKIQKKVQEGEPTVKTPLGKRKTSPKLCWGCLEEGKLKNMHAVHYHNGFREIYADMAKYCFVAKVKKDERLNYICENCIEKLRETLRFKQQISIAQNYLNQLTGGPPVKTDQYTGQRKVDDSSKPIAKSNGTNPVESVAQQSPANSLLVNQRLQLNPVPIAPANFRMPSQIKVQPTFMLASPPKLTPISQLSGNKTPVFKGNKIIKIRKFGMRTPQNNVIIFKKNQHHTLLRTPMKIANPMKLSPVNPFKVKLHLERGQVQTVNLDDSSDDEVQVVEDNNGNTRLPDYAEPMEIPLSYNTAEECYFTEDANTDSDYITATMCDT